MVPFLVLIFLPVIGFPSGVLLGLIAAVPAYRGARRLLKNPDTVSEIIPAQADSLLAFILFALGTGVGYLIR
jgi:1,4-dihydroxy-2-naphthoate octaprenyltransferase